MGVYLNHPDGVHRSPAFHKAAWLAQHHEAIPFHEIRHVEQTPAGHVVVVVVKNHNFDAAMAILTQYDLARVLNDPSGRPVIWLVMPKTAVVPMVEARHRHSVEGMP